MLSRTRCYAILVLLFSCSVSVRDWAQDDHILHQRWQGGGWVTEAQTSYERNAGGRVLTAIRSSRTDARWQPSEKDAYAYDGDGSPRAIYRYYRQDTPRVLLGRDIYTYDANGREVAVLWQRPSGEAWADARRTTYQYTEDGYHAKTQVMHWQDNGWQKVRTWITTEHDASDPGMQLGEGWRDDDTWGPTWRLRWTYSKDRREVVRLTEEWQNGTWVPYHNDYYHYDKAGNEVEQIRQNWVAGAWVNVSRDVASSLVEP